MISNEMIEKFETDCNSSNTEVLWQTKVSIEVWMSANKIWLLLNPSCSKRLQVARTKAIKGLRKNNHETAS